MIVIIILYKYFRVYIYSAYLHISVCVYMISHSISHSIPTIVCCFVIASVIVLVIVLVLVLLFHGRQVSARQGRKSNKGFKKAGEQSETGLRGSRGKRSVAPQLLHRSMSFR